MTKRLLFLVPLALFAVLVVVFALGLGRDPRLLPSVMINRPAPDFALPPLYAGRPGLTRQDLAGKVTLVNFFASWCVPCRAEAPALMALAQLKGITLDGIVYKDKSEDAKRFLTALGDPYRRLGVDASGRTAIDFGVYGVPETYVVDQKGRIRYRQVGPLTPDDLTQKILPMVERLAAAQPAERP